MTRKDILDIGNITHSRIHRFEALPGPSFMELRMSGKGQDFKLVC